ncbi:hypothetical protein [Dactylosporangium sp. NPDC048998]
MKHIGDAISTTHPGRIRLGVEAWLGPRGIDGALEPSDESP